MPTLIPPPHTSTILILNVPPSSHLGIDLVSFNTTPSFAGLKQVPPGLHHVWLSPAPSLFLRHGTWLRCDPGAVHVFSYSASSESLLSEPDLPVTDVLAAKASINAELWARGLTAYRQRDVNGNEVPDDAPWRRLIEHVDDRVLDEVYGARWAADTSSVAAGEEGEDEVLLGNIKVDGEPEERALNFTRIDLKRTWPPDAVGRERTLCAKDYSWRLEQTITKRPSPGVGFGLVLREEGLLGQWELAFVLATLVGNYPAGRFWLVVARLLCGCRSAVRTRPRLFTGFLRVLKRMLLLADTEDSAWLSEEMGTLERLLRGFGEGLREEEVLAGEVAEAFTELDKWVKSRFDWVLDRRDVVRRGMVQTEDGEMVELELEGAEEEDETGEFAPVVVEEIRDTPPLVRQEGGLGKEVVDTPYDHEPGFGRGGTEAESAEEREARELERQLGVGGEEEDMRY